jgi:AraC-like DNA-binding protein
MKNWKLSPKDLTVARYVECYWFLEKEAGDLIHNQPKLNPDPAAHLILVDRQQKYRYEQNSAIQTGSGCHWIFPHRKIFIMDHSDPFRMIGVKFRIGALYTLKFSDCLPGLDKVESVNIHNSFFPESFCVERLLTDIADDQDKVCDILDQMLTPWLFLSREDRHSELTRRILPLLEKCPIPEIGPVLHRSQRTIERSFLKTTHFTLKQCKSMIRLEEILNFLYKLDRKDIDWPDLACRFEFSDQPHLIRYLKSSIGETPADYAVKRDLAIDIYGDFEID